MLSEQDSRPRKRPRTGKAKEGSRKKPAEREQKRDATKYQRQRKAKSVTKSAVDISRDRILDEVADEAVEVDGEDDGNDHGVTYFEAYCRQARISNNVLEDTAEDPDNDAVEKELAQETAAVSLIRQDLWQAAMQKMETWTSLLQSGTNLLVHGFGSKRSVLDYFAENLACDGAVVVLKGYNVGLSLRLALSAILDDVFSQILGSQFPKRTVMEATESIRRCLDRSLADKERQDHRRETLARSCQRRDTDGSTGFPDRLYLVVHNIDGPPLRSLENQEALSLLAAHERVHLVASVDHVNAPLLWDLSMLYRYSWRWERIITLQPYEDELQFLAENSGVAPKERRIEGAKMLLRSLPIKGRLIVALIAEAQKEELQKNKNGNVCSGGLTLEMLTELCRKKFLASNPAAVNSVLTELQDHNLLDMVHGQDGSDEIRLTLSPDEILKVLSEA